MFGAQAWPSAATYTTFASVGSMAMRPICRVSASPMNAQVLPASVDLYTPPPGEMELRESASPVPAHTTAVSPGATASALTVETFSWSNTGVQVVPAFTVRHRPPVAKPTNISFGLCGLPATALTRPLMLAGPMDRQVNAGRMVVSGCAPWARAGSSGTSTRSEDANSALRMERPWLWRCDG